MILLYGINPRTSLLHRLDHGFDELALGGGEGVFVVELAVDFGKWTGPVDVG